MRNHVIALLLLGAGAPAAERVQGWPAWQRGRVALERCFVCDEFQIHYTLSGTNALPVADQCDDDHDGVPDKIQNIARQLQTAKRCYVEALGLRHPLESPRYKGRVQHIDVNLWALSGKNGMAGDAIVNYHRPGDPPEGVAVVTVDLSAKLPARNLSPAHELFHIFQNGYSLFKNAWYYEGLARWSEDLLRAGVGEAGALPASAAEVEALFKRSYDASRFWQELARVTDPAGTVRIPLDLRTTGYIGGGKPIIEDDRFRGAALLKALLEELDRADDVVARQRGLDPLDWSEGQQRSGENDRAIWAAMLTVSRRLAPDAPQLKPMLTALGVDAVRPQIP